MNQQLFNASLKHLSSHNITTHELQSLLEKEFSNLENLDEEIRETIARLEELHLINDDYFAKNIARKYQHKGNRFIKQSLMQKGMSEALANDAITSLPPETERALIEAQKKWRSIKGDDHRGKENKLLRFLSGRGFSMESCYHCLKQIGAHLEQS